MVYGIEIVDCIIKHTHKHMGTILRNIKKPGNEVGVGGEVGRGWVMVGVWVNWQIRKFSNFKIITEGQLFWALQQSRIPVRIPYWATFFHSVSTDSDPHHFCYPAGEDSWCFWWPLLCHPQSCVSMWQCGYAACDGRSVAASSSVSQWSSH